MSLRKNADMLVLRSKLPLLPARSTDNTAPKRDWSAFDAPAWKRWSKPHPLRDREELPAFLKRQAS